MIYRNRLKTALVAYNERHKKDEGFELVTQKDLAEIVVDDKDVQAATRTQIINRWCKQKDDIPSRYVVKLAEFLETTPNYIMCFEEGPKHELVNVAGNIDYTLRCVRCYDTKPLKSISHKANDKEVHGVVGIVFACTDCWDAVIGSNIEIEFKE